MIMDTWYAPGEEQPFSGASRPLQFFKMFLKVLWLLDKELRSAIVCRVNILVLATEGVESTERY